MVRGVAVVSVAAMVSFVVLVAAMNDGNTVVAVDRMIVAIVGYDHAAFVDWTAAVAMTTFVGITCATVFVAMFVTGFGILSQGDESEQDAG